MAEVTAGFETGTLGNTLSAGDTGDATPYDFVNIDGSGACVYDDTHVNNGSLACKVTTWGSSSTTGTGFRWTTGGGLDAATDWYGRVYLYLTAWPPQTLIFLQCPSYSSRNVRLQIGTDGRVSFVDSVGGAATGTATVSLNQWIRIEWHSVHSATVGQVEVKLFNDPEADATETLTGTSNYNTGTSAGGCHIGSTGNTPDGFVYWVDDIVLNATSYPGPVLPGMQTLLASADSVDGAWTDQAGGTSLVGAIDEATFDDTDYIRSEVNPTSSGCRVKLAAGDDPAVSTGHKIVWRTGKIGNGTINMTVKLYQGGGDAQAGGTLIASFTRNGVGQLRTFTETLSGAEADAITDYTDLYLEFFADET